MQTRKLWHFSLCNPCLAICVNNTIVYMDPSLSKIVFKKGKYDRGKKVRNEIQIFVLSAADLYQQYAMSTVWTMLASGTALTLPCWKMLPSPKRLRDGSLQIVKLQKTLWASPQWWVRQPWALQCHWLQTRLRKCTILFLLFHCILGIGFHFVTSSL